jgi:glyoxylase-like metal-dependent hydrolase (beta-lactamase superfamily II)
MMPLIRKRPMSDVGKITQVESNLFYLDSRKVDSFGGSGVYLVEGDGLTLIETGSSLVAAHVLEAVHDMGYRERDIRRAIVTHIHLDHAGGAGLLVRKLPKIKIYVHERGAKHLLDPTILIKSAKMVYGSLEKIVAVHGEIFPIPNQNLIPLSETCLEIGGGVSLKIFNAPGHAPHHLCMFEPDRGWLFTGEALGHYRPESDTLTTAVAPPGFDLEASRKTMKRILKLKPRMICFSQYGQHADPALVIEESVRQLDSYDEIIGPMLKRGLGRNEIIHEMLRALEEEGEIDREVVRHKLTSLVHGFETYYRRRMKGTD